MITTESFVHEAMLYSSDEEFIDGVAPYVNEGIEQGDVLTMVSTARNNELVKEKFGHVDIDYVEATDAYRRPAVTIAWFEQHARRALAAGRKMRVVGEVQFGANRTQQREWIRYESVINELYHRYPAHGLCPYNTRELPADIVGSALRTHPFLRQGADVVPNQLCDDVPTVLSDIDDDVAVDGLTVDHPAIDISNLSDVADLRRRVYVTATGSGVPFDLVGDFVLAVSEVARNALSYGESPVRVQMWWEPHRLLCDIIDQGSGFSDPLAGLRCPEAEQMSHAGLWIARQLCDQFEATHTRQGFRVRLGLEG